MLLVLVALAVLAAYAAALFCCWPRAGENLRSLELDLTSCLDVQRKFNTNHNDKWQATVTGEAKTLQEWTIDGREGPSCVRPLNTPSNATKGRRYLVQLAQLAFSAASSESLRA